MSEIDLSQYVGKTIKVKKRNGETYTLPVAWNDYPIASGEYAYTLNGRFYCPDDADSASGNNGEDCFDIIEILPDDPPTPKWEIGKHYPMRDSQHFGVVTTIGPFGNLFGYYYRKDRPDFWSASIWRDTGRFRSEHEQHDFDLMPDAPPVSTKRAGWINVYQTHEVYYSCSMYFGTKEQADRRAMSDRIACIRVEFTSGEGLGP